MGYSAVFYKAVAEEVDLKCKLLLLSVIITVLTLCVASHLNSAAKEPFLSALVRLCVADCV